MQKKKAAFNVIDILIIILVVALGLAAYFLFFRQKDPAEGGSEASIVKVEYVLQVSELAEEYADNIEKGDVIIDYGTHTDAGEVVSVDPKPYVYTGHDKETGKQNLTEVDGYVNLFITVQGEAFMKGETYYINDTSMYINKRLDIMHPDLFCSGTCVSFKVVE